MSSTENNTPGTPGWSFEAVEPRPVPADSVARLLREARTDANQELEEIAQFLRIRYDYLLAIEEGRFEDLPGPTYAVGFVRAYADHLKLDSDAIANSFKAEVADLSDRTELVFPTPAPESRIPGSTIILFSVFLIAGAYGVWYYFSSDLEQQVVQQGPAVESAPTETPAPVETPAPGADQTAAATPDRSTTDFPEDSSAVPEPPAADPQVNGTPTLEGESADPSLPPAVPAVAEEAPPLADPVTEALPAAEAAEVAEIPEVPPVPEEVPTAAEAAGAAEAAESEPEETAAEQTAPEGDTETAAAEPAEAEPQAPEADTEETVAAAEAPAILDNDAAEAVAAESVVSSAEDTELPEPVGDPIPQAAEVGVPPLPPTTPARRPSVQPDTVETAALGESSEGTTVYGSENASARVVVRAVFDSYVLIRDANDNLLLTKVLRSGDIYRVPDQAGLTMLTGNAGGLQIEVDGQQAPTIGPVGAIVRNVSLDPVRLTSGTAVNR